MKMKDMLVMDYLKKKVRILFKNKKKEIKLIHMLFLLNIIMMGEIMMKMVK